MIQLSVETLANNALDNVIRQLQTNADNLKGDEVATLSSVYANDIADVRVIRNYLLSLDSNFRRVVEMIMDLDTAPREVILEEFKRQGLRPAVEETGLVMYIDKEPPILEAHVVLRAIEWVKREHEDAVVFYNGELVAVLAGEARGMYEVHVATNPRQIA